MYNIYHITSMLYTVASFLISKSPDDIITGAFRVLIIPILGLLWRITKVALPLLMSIKEKTDKLDMLWEDYTQRKQVDDEFRRFVYMNLPK